MVRLGSGFSLSIIDPSCFLGATDNLEHTIVDFDYVKQGKYAGEQCHVIDVVYLDGQRTRRLWISNKDHLPRRLIDTVKVHNRELVTEEIWQDIKPNINIADNRFKWQPPDDWSRFFLPPKKGHKHMKGQFAPDFEFTTINGSKIRLANLRGKVVWLVFWRLGCPPCRLELPRLQKVYDKHKDQGGYVLAFNFSDGIELVKQYCSQNSFTFPMILDHSDEAIDIGTQVYGATSFPYNYIIDSNGIILHVEEGMVMDSSWESLEVFENEISKGF
jgi:peroxiredoxin